MSTALRVRICFAVAALTGVAAPVAWIVRWDEVSFFAVMVGAVAVPVLLYVLFIRSLPMSIATGAFLVVFVFALTIPGYPLYFGHEGTGAGGPAWLLFGISPLCLVAFGIGFLGDLPLRPAKATATRRPAPPPAPGEPPDGAVVREAVPDGSTD